MEQDDIVELRKQSIKWAYR